MAAAAADKSGGSGGSIARQTSIYSLTLDEFQNTMEPGKNFGSMNMDEFLKNIWTAEESQAIAAAIGPENSALFRQPSLRQPLPRTLSRKTVDEVWKDIHGPGDADGDAAKLPQRQMTLGEMTLEDFLVKAGVMKDEEGFPVRKSNLDVGALTLAQAQTEAPIEQQQQQQQEWLASQYGNPAAMATIAQQQQQQQQFLQQQAVEVAAYMNAKGMNGLGFSSGSPPSPGSDSQGNGFGMSSGYGMDSRGRKRGLEGPVEVVLERRQRRMIKNRESAARSRARKQAYTVELEAEVTHLKEENMKLKKMQEEAEMRDRKRAQVLEGIVARNQNQSEYVNKPKALRRTLTGPW